MTVIAPAYNEAKSIAAKIDNLAQCDFPRDRVRILIGDDGSTDDTAAIARKAAARHPTLDIDVVSFDRNRGKASVINDLVARAQSEIIILTDISAMAPADGVSRLVDRFCDPAIGAVGAGYSVANVSGDAAASYWTAQTRVKGGESILFGLNGAHGALYAIRRAAFEALEPDTINDDYIIPLRIAMRGYRTIYDPTIIAFERDRVAERDDFHRRKRIGAGNLQQVVRLARDRRFWRPRVAIPCLLSKAARVAAPFFLAVAFVVSLALAPTSPLFAAFAAAQAAGLCLAGLGLTVLKDVAPLRAAGYIVRSYAAIGLGALEYAFGVRRRPGANGETVNYIPATTRIAKRALDIVGAATALILTAPVTPFIALAIKLESPGPVFFRQLRVGRMDHDRTVLFEMIKFRSMREDAEKATGAVWATERDPRITRVGGFLRKTRLDEIPQMINVLRGDMSLIGPRPERPGFYARLEKGVPFYAERTYGLRPGVTGLAQVSQGYDADIEDVRNKAMYDHAYAASLTSPVEWLKRDIEIVFRTLTVMATGRGQ
ncbi:MAG: sugar transferase [Pseudomonadota bacterium]